MKRKVNRSRKTAKRNCAKVMRTKMNLTEIDSEIQDFVKIVSGSATFERGIMKEKIVVPRSIETTRIFLARY